VLTWERRLAKKYYDKLFKEYAIADLSRYKEGAVGLRWRTEREVVSGKGQFSCGAKRCEQYNDLESYEVDFNYREAGEKKQALVKLRVCPDCGRRLNFRHARKKAKRQAKEERREAKRRRVSPAAEEAEAAVADDAGDGAAASTAAARSESNAQLRAAAAHSTESKAGETSSLVAAAEGASSGSRVATAAAAGAAGAAGAAAAGAPDDSDSVWSQPVRPEKTIADEFDEYFDDLMQ